MESTHPQGNLLVYEYKRVKQIRTIITFIPKQIILGHETNTFTLCINTAKKIVKMREKKGIFAKIFDMFMWTSGCQKSLAHTDFNMFVDEC